MSNAILKITGLRYEASESYLGPPPPTKTHVFFPAYQLNLSEEGIVKKMEQPLMTVQQARCEVLYLEKLQNDDFFECSIEGIQRAKEEANNTAFTVIHVPEELVSRVNTLYETIVSLNRMAEREGSNPGLLPQIENLNNLIRRDIQSSHIFVQSS